MNLSLAIVFMFSGAALTTLGVVLYKRMQEDEKKEKES
jgi:hypothetical protein